MKSGNPLALLGISAAFALIAALASPVCAGSTGPDGEEMISQLIVKPRALAGAGLSRALAAFDAGGLSKNAAVPMKVFRAMSGNGYVVRLDRPVTLSEARVISRRLMRNDVGVEYAEPDRVVHPTATTPSDPGYLPYQWHYFAPAEASDQGGANLPEAWDVTGGAASVIVAVIDTGYRPHADLGTVVPGYDFITDAARANDGDGRDADAQDPGDWVEAGECGTAKNSSWHGTHVAGTIAALMNNGIGGTGVAPDVRILPVRVLGKCGGLISDIVDGMRWAAGLNVSGVPANPRPATVMNMSLGGPGTCSATFQYAVNDIIDAGKAIVASTGNNGTTSVGQPANCDGVFAVTAHSITGSHAAYADIGAETMVSAPGGDYLGGVYSLSNTGSTVPAVDSYAAMTGTSMAAPHVAGVAALMLSVNPSLTPAQIRSYLRSSARAFPEGDICATTYAGLCGSGLLDAAGALYTIPAAPPTVSVTNPSQIVPPGTTVSLAGSATAEPPRGIETYQWTQISGASVGVIGNANTASATFTSPATGSYSFRLTATDSTGRAGTATAAVRVNSPPVLAAVAAQTVTSGNSLAFTVGATDVDGDIPIFHPVSLPAGATLSANGEFNWPGATPAGSHVMTYYASDDYGADSATGTVRITVTEVPAAAGAGGGGGCAVAGTAGGGIADLAGAFGAMLLPLAWSGIRRAFRRFAGGKNRRAP